jgi:hypothetical protein
MKMHFLVAPILALAMSGCATATEPRPEQVAELTVVKADTRLPFAGQRVHDWTRRQDGSLLIQATNDKFYHATFRGACPWLDTATSIAFKSNIGNLDKFSSILVEGNTCLFNSFDEVADPRPPKAT